MRGSHSDFHRSTLFDFLNRALHVEISFRHVVVFAVQYLLEAANRVRYGNLFTLTAREDLRHAERLAQEPLNLAARNTVILSSGESSSMPRIAMMSCRFLYR